MAVRSISRACNHQLEGKEIRLVTSGSGSETERVDPLVTDLDWPRLVGGRLEELLWGLLSDMGGTDMSWRAGTTNGVHAADGGRDIELTFRSPSDDGGTLHERWWVESKGRERTVGKRLVQDAVLNALAYSDVDVILVATNSVFTNSAHDWVRGWNASRRGARAILWDRENLASMVRSAPTVAARVLPEALDSRDRLALLIERFEKFGETPSPVDLEFFWQHPEIVIAYDNPTVAVGVLLHADSDDEWERRPWISLLMDVAPLEVFASSLSWVPGQLLGESVRPKSAQRQTLVAAFLLMSVVDRVDPEQAAKVSANVWAAWEGSEEMAALEARDHGWQKWIVMPILAEARRHAATLCGHDCARVSTEVTAFRPPMTATRYFAGFKPPDERTDRWLTIIDRRVPCLAGSALASDGSCIVTREVSHEYGPTADFFADLAAVVAFRRLHPDGQYLVGAGLREG